MTLDDAVSVYETCTLFLTPSCSTSCYLMIFISWRLRVVWVRVPKTYDIVCTCDPMASKFHNCPFQQRLHLQALAGPYALPKLYVYVDSIV